MKILSDKRLFWFLKEGSPLDLANPSTLDMYVQQIATRGNTGDVKTLLKNVRITDLKQSFQRLKSFLPVEVRQFWEDFLASH